MTPAPDVHATSATAPTTAIQRVSSGGGGHSLATERVEAASGTSFAGISAQTKSSTEQDPGQSSGNDTQQQSPRSNWFTPLIFRAALGFASVSPTQADWRNGGTTFLADLQYGLGIYEFNMKVTGGGASLQGSVINQYS